MRPQFNFDEPSKEQREGVPPGLPNWITRELIDATIRVWQPYYETILTPEEAATMIQSVGRLYQALSSGSPP